MSGVSETLGQVKNMASSFNPMDITKSLGKENRMNLLPTKDPSDSG